MEEGWYNKFVIKRFQKVLHDHFSYSDTPFKLKKRAVISQNQAFYKLKTVFDFNDMCIVADNLSEKYDKYLYGNPIPKGIEQLGESEYILESSTLEDEINWFFLTLRKYENRFTKFIDLKHEFDNCLLLGDYKNALHFLDQIESKICISLWGIENRLLIKEMMDGLEENKLFLNEINDSNKSGRIISLADFLSKRAEKELSGNRYKNDISNALSRIEGNLKKETIEYYLFKTNYHQLEKYDAKCFINSIEFQHSLIDRYLAFIRILQNQLINIDKVKDLDMIKSRLYYASKKLEKDGLIENMRLFVDPTVEFSNIRLDSTAIEILDDYSSGDYYQVVLKLKKYLPLNPKNFELYVIYAKSLLNLKTGKL